MWAGIISAVLQGLGTDWHTFTSWEILLQHIYQFICNPASIIYATIIIFSSINNPTHKNGI